MGGSKSQTVKQFLNMDALNQTITNNITKNATKVGSTQTNINKLKIVIRGSVIGCQINSSQKIDAKNVSTVDASVQEIVSMKTEIANAMEQSAAANMEMLTELGSLSDVVGKSNQNIEQEINTTIRNIVETNITTENLTELFAEQVNINQEEFIIGGNFVCPEGKGGLNLSQDITAVLSASAVTDQITEKLMETSIVNELTQAAEASVKQENTGFASIIDSIGGIFTGIGSMYGVSALLICCVCIIALVMLPKLMGGGGAPPNAGGGANAGGGGGGNGGGGGGGFGGFGGFGDKFGAMKGKFGAMKGKFGKFM